MLTMTTIGNISPEIQPKSEPQESSGSASLNTEAMVACSGLSALINAATVRLASEANASENSRPSDHPTTFTQSTTHDVTDASHSDSTSHTLSPTATTPTMLPEAHNTHEQSFLQVLMTVLTDPANSNIITFLPDGKFFAVRPQEFSTNVMKKHFLSDSYSEFLSQLSQWGFSSIGNATDAIQIFRHPHFRRDHRDIYAKIISSTNQTTQERAPARMESQLRLENERNGHANHVTFDNDSKRKLSPQNSQRDVCQSSNSSQRLRLVSSDGEQEKKPTEPLVRRKSDGGRDLSQRIEGEPLVQEGVKSATQSIVADAIESLLWDEEHSKQTYRRHEQALTKSALPGVEPITKQLFDPSSTGSSRESVSSSNDSSTADCRMEQSDPEEPHGPHATTEL